VFLKQNDHLISIYYLKMTKNKTDKTNGCVFGSNTCRKNEPEACFYLFPRCGVKAKYVFTENIFDSKDRVERRKPLESALLVGEPASNYMRVRGKHFKKDDYICE
jgi:hypothetical protein